MPYDLFISYSRSDKERGQVTALKAQIFACQAMRQCLGEGVAPVFFVTLPAAADPKTDQALARWIDEIQRRQTFDLRPWHDAGLCRAGVASATQAGEQALQQAHVRQTLEQLHASVRERLDRAERSRNSPNNLIKHNPAFVGRVRELTGLRKALTKNKLGVVGAREGQMPGRATVRGLGGMGKTPLTENAYSSAGQYGSGQARALLQVRLGTGKGVAKS